MDLDRASGTGTQVPSDLKNRLATGASFHDAKHMAQPVGRGRRTDDFACEDGGFVDIGRDVPTAPAQRSDDDSIDVG